MKRTDSWGVLYYFGDMQCLEVCTSMDNAFDRFKMWKSQGFMCNVMNMGSNYYAK